MWSFKVKFRTADETIELLVAAVSDTWAKNVAYTDFYQLHPNATVEWVGVELYGMPVMG